MTLHPIPMPQTTGAFADFMRQQNDELMRAEILLRQIERVMPNWRGYRSLAEAVEVGNHHAEQMQPQIV